LGINLQRSNIAIERAKINYESNEISLDKQIFDTRQQVETLRRNLLAASSDAQQNLLQVQDNLNSSDINN
jgi:DNA-binding protein YbaB